MPIHPSIGYILGPYNLMAVYVLSLRMFVGLLIGLRHSMLPAYASHGGGSGLYHVGGDVIRARFTAVDVLSPRMFVGLLIRLCHAMLPAYVSHGGGAGLRHIGGDGVARPHGGGRAQPARIRGTTRRTRGSRAGLHGSIIIF